MRIALTFLLVLLFVSGCRKEKQPQIPYVYVNLQLYPNSLDYIPVGGHKYFNGGFRGIVVYRSLEEQFEVYERCCPYDPQKTNAKVSVNANGTTCLDSICMSKFILMDGTPYSGPSPYSLMRYHCTYDGDILMVFN